MNTLVKYFLRGLLITVPIAVTGYVLYLLFVTIDRWLGLPIPGLGFLAVIALTTVIGLLASNIITRKLFELPEKLFARLPLVKLVYFSLKDLVGAFVGEKKGFQRPVVVSLDPEGSVRLLGFLTRSGFDIPQLEAYVAVYFPQSYNFAGNVLVVPKDRVTPLRAASAEVMSFIVSGGVAGLAAPKD